MKRSGFTMIELIFVIVILGILAAVALPKFIGVSEQAQVGKVTGYVGTLNRTVGPALWSESISNRDLGSVRAGGVSGTNYDNVLLAQIETPTGVGDSTAVDLTAPTVSTCAPSTTAATWVNPDLPTNAELAGLVAISTVTMGGNAYSIRCIDGSMTAAPRFVFTDDSTTPPTVLAK